MDKIEELRSDLADLEKLLALAERPKVKDILNIESRKLATNISKLEEDLKVVNIESAVVPKTTANKCYEVRLNNYAWDQSNKFVKFYVSLKNVHSLPAENVNCTFTNKSLEMTVKNLDNKDYIFSIKNLLNPVNPADSTWKVKSDLVLINVAKVQQTNWSHVTEVEKRASESRKMPNLSKNPDPSDGLMSIMKNMYEYGDDEMKRTIAKAWTENQGKQGPM